MHDANLYKTSKKIETRVSKMLAMATSQHESRLFQGFICDLGLHHAAHSTHATHAAHTSHSSRTIIL